jgi:hypothetical protein
VTVSGEVLFARYAYPPNELGYCGPSDSDAVLTAAGSISSQPIDGFRERARAFDGAWAYLEVIAAATGLDPLDPRVVEAYWIGSSLLDDVDPDQFKREVRARFASETAADWGALDDPRAAFAHHSFQVFVVYPWVRMLGRGDTPLHILDRCRIRSGVVQSVDGNAVVVRSRPLTWNGQALSVGPAVEERVRWAQGSRSLLSAAAEADPVAAGDTVAIHWDWVCDRLSPGQVTALVDRTNRQLELTNRAVV